MGKFQDLIAYKKAFDLAMQIFVISKKFPKEETYSLTDQVRRSSRSVCSNIAEGYKKRLYPNHFISKLSDADMENAESQVWLEFALACGYLDSSNFDSMYKQTDEISKLINYMIIHPDKFL